MRHLNIMNFAAQTRVDELIGVTLADGVTTDYIESRPFNIEGVFHIDLKVDESELIGLYRIENARIVQDPKPSSARKTGR